MTNHKTTSKVAKKPTKNPRVVKKVKGTEKQVPSSLTRKHSQTFVLKEQVKALSEQLTSTTEAYGKLLAELTNMRIQQDVMLGQILKALYIIGINPDRIARKCQTMFLKKVVED